MKCPSCKSAFTLIEMLVVIAIIALLAALITPAVNRSLARARSVKCLAHLKQIGIAVSAFSSDHKGKIPLVTNQLNGTSPGKQHWFQYLSGYVGRKSSGFVDPFDRSSVFWGCPEWKGRDYSWNIPPQGPISPASTGYGMNLNPERPDNINANARDDLQNIHIYGLEQIRLPSSRVLIGDSMNWHMVATWNVDNGFLGFVSWSPGDPLRHGKTANYLFFDMHAKSIPGHEAHLYLYDPARAGQ